MKKISVFEFGSIAISITLIIALLVGVLLRIPPDENIRNVDEIISRDVVGGMLDRKDFNPDWQK